MNKPTLIIIFFLSAASFAKAQKHISSDELFRSARYAAFEDKNYDKAKQYARQALAISPTYADIEIFLGRVFTWEKQYDSARYHFSKVLSTAPINEDASIAYADLEYWTDNYDKALNICNNALAVYPASEALLLRKAKNLNASKKFKEASLTTTQLLKINKHNTGALALASTLKDAVAINKVGVSYDNSSFDKQFDKSWKLGSISYGRQTKLGSITARINYANRFGTNGMQGEVDAYPRISKTFYSYVSFGYSGNVGVFPKYRAGFSLYANLPKSFEAEAGLRYLYFTSATNVYTLYVGKYYKSFLFSVRTYITPSNGAVSQSYSIAGRYYFKGAEDYIGLSAGTGISPDDANQNVQFNNKQTKLTTRQISASFSHTFLKWNVISISAGVINQEYRPSIKGNQINLSAGLSRRF
ncbi:MAG TPA: YaiO family outer membrane beta-barrel protein [Chitinophagaceae bacterium]